MGRYSRRRFNSMFAASGLAPAIVGLRAIAESAAHPQAEQFSLAERLDAQQPEIPVILYPGVQPANGDAAINMEALFLGNGWPPQWRNGVYTFHHYHSTAHEVLGFASGEARLVLGGEGGHELTVHAGDVLLLPAGTGHCEVSCSSDFLVIGAYPPGQHWDICRTAPSADTQASMARVPFPHSDPVHGSGGPMSRLWHPS